MSIEKPIQVPSEVKLIIGNNDIDQVTKNILLNETSLDKFKLCYFETIKKPDIKIGKKAHEISELSVILQNAISEKFPNGLYEYQEKAISKIIDNKDVVISAPTGTGKTESFLIPIIQNILNNPSSLKPQAVLVYPTKALAKDQHQKIKAFAEKCGVRVNLVDGDVPSKDFRTYVLHNSPEIFITNFDFIKYQLHQETSQWKPFFANIHTLVIDEAHYYGGILGSNVYYIIKSLKRLAKNHLQIITASATLENAQEFCMRLGGRRFEYVEEKNKPGVTDFAIVSEQNSEQLDVMLDLLETFYRQKKKTIVFHDSHDKAERFAWKALRERKIPIGVHRAGMLTKEREQIEQQFKDNDIICISCTPTLELGIDIGDVDVVISSTVSYSRFKQRLGRAGRNHQRSFAFLVLGKDPISKWYQNHPTDYMTQKESVLIDPNNRFVKNKMLLLLAAAKPISKDDDIAKNLSMTLNYHLKEKNLVEYDGKYHLNYQRTKILLNDYSIRGMGENVYIETRGNWNTIGTRATPVAYFKFYHGAIYMHNSQHYYVTDYLQKRKYSKAIVEPLNYESYKVDPYYTKPILEITPKIIRKIKTAKIKHTETAFCELLIKIKIYGFYKLSVKTNKIIDTPIRYSAPMEFEFFTAGFVFQAPKLATLNSGPQGNGITCNLCPQTQWDYTQGENANILENEAGYHATEHLLINAGLTIANTANSDLCGYSTHDGKIYLYDSSVNGGNGATEAVFRKLEAVFARSLQMAKECECKEHQGCPLCTHIYNCERCNNSLSKHRAIEILESLNSDSPKTISENNPSDSKPVEKTITSNDWMSGSEFPENPSLDKSVMVPLHEENLTEYDPAKEFEKSVKYRGFARYGGYGNSIDKLSYTWSDY